MKQMTIFMVIMVLAVTPLTKAYSHELKLDGDGLHATATASSHAPIGVMGDHMHHQGEWMLSYRYMHMDMNGSRKGTSDIDTVTIATTEPNRFFGIAGQPATLRIVPTDMTMDMHMFGGMAAPTDWLTLMVMGTYLKKDMTSTTFAGGAGTTVLGTSDMESSGWGDTRLTGMFRLYQDSVNHLHLNAGISLPTGSTSETGTMLMPNGTRMNMRMGYGMQLGTGTYDLLPGLTYTGHQGRWGWGAQYSAEIRLENKNDDGYSWGDKHSVTGWGSYSWADWISTSARG